MYRILQESLANAARHAPGAAVEVTIRHATPSATVHVVNGPASGRLGTPVTGHESTGGNGIAGMRERAHAVGGVLATRERSDGGFEVRAEFPAAST